MKRGEIPQATVLESIADIQGRIEDDLVAERTPLPAEPDWERLGAWSTSAHRRHWGW